MRRPLSCSQRPTWVSLSLQWLVLWVVFLGAVVSSVGAMSSHGISAISASEHALTTPAQASHDPHGHAHEHEHAHDEADSAFVSGHPAGAAHHAHHGADHSHDKAHAVAVEWRTVLPALPEWQSTAKPWLQDIQASRLERPPMV